MMNINHTALLVIDVQEIMFYGEHPVYRGEEVFMKIKALIDQAKQANIPVIYIQHTGSDDSLMGRGKPLWQIKSSIQPEPGEPVFLKYTPDAFHETGLRDKLNSLEINQLIITGMQTEICVDTTCRSAFALGYQITLVSDAHTTFDTEILPAEKIIIHHNQIIQSWFGEVKSSGEIKLFLEENKKTISSE